MRHNLNFTIILFSLALILVISCQEKEKPQEIPTDTFLIYSAKDTLLEKENTTVLVPDVDKTILIESDKSVLEKARMIADTLSKYHFEGLRIVVEDTLRDANDQKVYSIHLLESPDFTGPGSVPGRSWYDFFQGSYGGQHTAIALSESMFQRKYTGPWMDRLIFFYQGEPMEALDHIDLSGVRVR